MTHTTLPTIQAIETIHRAQVLLNSRKLKGSQAADLSELTDAVLSFTGFYLKQPNPACRPEQRMAFELLQAHVTQLEKAYGNQIIST